MRLISPGANPPADVDRYLLPHEQEVITVRKHPAVLLAPVAWAVVGLVIAAVGIPIQIAGGADYPTVPPGLIISLVAAARRRPRIVS